MYTSHLLHFTYSIKIKIIIIGKHVLNEPPPPPYLTVKGLYYTLPKKLFTCKNTAVRRFTSSNIVPIDQDSKWGRMPFLPPYPLWAARHKSVH